MFPVDSTTDNPTRLWYWYVVPTAAQAVRHTDRARWLGTHRAPVTSRALGAHAREHQHEHATAAAMASGGGDPRPEDDPFSDGEISESDSAEESRPQRMGAHRPGATNNPILTRLAVSRNPSPLAAATAAPGVCLLRFAWESAAGSLVGAVVGYGKTHAARLLRSSPASPRSNGTSA